MRPKHVDFPPGGAFTEVYKVLIFYTQESMRLYETFPPVYIPRYDTPGAYACEWGKWSVKAHLLICSPIVLLPWLRWDSRSNQVVKCHNIR